MTTDTLVLSILDKCGMAETRKNPEQMPGVERIEANVERVPNREEVRGMFEQLISGKYTETRIQEDESGLYLWEVEVAGEKAGEVTELSYRRGVGGPAKNGKLHSISIVYYEDGIPVGGKTAADCERGVWKLR